MQPKSTDAPVPPSFEITTPKQERAYFHPVRMKILNFLTRERLTVSQVAERLRVHPANITHHFRILERARLIRLVEKRDIGRVIEKYYAAVAATFDVRPAPEAVRSVNRKTLSVLGDDLVANAKLLREDDSENLTGLIKRARIDAKRFKVFENRLQKLIDDFGATSREPGALYALNVSLYPHKVDYGPLGTYELKGKQRLKLVK